MPAPFPIFEALLKLELWDMIPFNVIYACKMTVFYGFLIVGERKMSHGAISGERGG